MKILDPNDPFFRPVWRRWAAVVAPVVWGGFEAYSGSPEWGILFAFAGAYAFYILIFKGPSGSE